MTQNEPARSKKQPARVFHAELWGRRAEKYHWLRQQSFGTTSWQELHPSSPFYLFVPRDEKAAAGYEQYPSLKDIFPLNSVGIVTARDRLTIHWTPEEVWETVQRFVSLDPEEAREEFALGKDAQDWKVAKAQQDLRDSRLSRDRVVPILYRPFDVRYTYYTGCSQGFHCRPRPEVMRHMLAGDNIALITPRQHKDEFGALVTMTIGAHKSVAAYDINYYFPLSVCATGEREETASCDGACAGYSNVNQEVLKCTGSAHGRERTPGDILDYVYAVLYTPAYREKYADFLRLDFPRIPFTADAELFRQMAGLGGRLVELHLLRSAELDPPVARFEGQAPKALPNGTVARGFPKYDDGQQRVYINEGQYFAPVPPEVWEYPIGGYQVCEKWLKDRRRRRLGLGELQTYCRIVTALEKTREIESQLDEIYPAVERNTISFPNEG